MDQGGAPGFEFGGAGQAGPARFHLLGGRVGHGRDAGTVAGLLGPTARLLGQFDLDDIETTVRTVRAITERAAEEAL